MNRRTGYLSFFAASVIYGTFGVFIRALQGSFDALQQVVLRSAVAAAILLPLMFATTAAAERRKLRDPRLVLFALLFPFSMTLWTWATIVGTVRSAIFGLYLGSLIGAAILGKIFFREELNSRRIAGLGLSLIGLSVFCLPLAATVSSAPSLLLGAVAGLFQALALCMRRWLTGINRTVVLAAQSLGPLLVCSALCALFDPIALSSVSPQVVAISCGYGVVVVLVSYLVLLGSQNLEIGQGTIILSTELIWAALIAAAFLNETPTFNECIGCLFLFSAAAIVKSDAAAAGKSARCAEKQ